jgi:hypothetical protein
MSVDRGVKVHLPAELFSGMQVRAVPVVLHLRKRARVSQLSGLSNGRTRPQVAVQAKPLPPRVVLLKELHPAHIHLKANLEVAVVPKNRVGAPGAAVPVHRSDPAIGEVPPVQVQAAAGEVLEAVLAAVVPAAAVPVAAVPVAAAHDLPTGNSQT